MFPQVTLSGTVFIDENLHKYFFLEDAPSVDEVTRQANIELQAENRNLQALHTTLHEKYHLNSLKVAELQDSVTARETEIAELKNQIDDLQYEFDKVLLITLNSKILQVSFQLRNLAL